MQSLIPALLFVPGVSPLRVLSRVMTYLLALPAWWSVASEGKPSPEAKSFPARPWLTFCAVALLLELIHPNNYSMITAVGQVVIYIMTLSPAFWAGESMRSPRQLTRIMAIIFAVNSLSAALGVAQMYSDRFNPPVIPMANNLYGGENLKISVNGRMVFRPCGLSDSPGAAAPAGATAALLGLCFALRPIGALRRIGCAGLAFVGVAVIYYTAVRTSLVTLVMSVMVMTALMAVRGNVANALMLACGGGGMVVGSLLWVARRMGSGVMDRVGTLTGSKASETLVNSRGLFVWEALTKIVWENPLGYGLGWWGTIHGTFGNAYKLSLIWVEVMISAWAYDGGFPLLIGYSGALAVTVANSLRIALRARDPDVVFWAPLVVAMNLGTVAICFSYVPFVTPIGQQFWLLNAALHVADAKTRSRPARPGGARKRRPAAPGFGPAAPGAGPVPV